MDSNHRFTTDPGRAAADGRARVCRRRLRRRLDAGRDVRAADGSSGPGPVPTCVVTPSDSTPNVGSSLDPHGSLQQFADGVHVDRLRERDIDVHRNVSRSGAGCVFGRCAQCRGSERTGERHRLVGSGGCGRDLHAGAHVANRSAARQLSVVLAVTCDKVAGSYTWNGCSSTSNICIARETTPGPHTYSVFVRTSAGASNPATMTLGWVSSPPSPPGLCAQFPSYLWSDVGSQSARVESARMINPPAFAWNGAWTVRFVVPSTIGTRVGRLSAAEFAGEPTVARGNDLEDTVRFPRDRPVRSQRSGVACVGNIRDQLFHRRSVAARLPGAATGWHVLLQPAQLQPVERDDFMSVVAGPLRCVHRIVASTVTRGGATRRRRALHWFSASF